MSIKTQRTVVGIVLTAFVVLTIGILYLQLPSLPGNTTNTTEEPPILDPVSPSLHPPENSTDYELITVGSLLLNATGDISGMIPHSGPIDFYVNLMLNITNNGTEDVTDFHAIKVSLYYLDAELFYTFGLTPDTNFTIPAGQSVILTLHNNITRIDTSFSMASLYARVLVSFDIDQECILTTPILEGIFAIE